MIKKGTDKYINKIPRSLRLYEIHKKMLSEDLLISLREYYQCEWKNNTQKKQTERKKRKERKKERKKERITTLPNPRHWVKTQRKIVRKRKESWKWNNNNNNNNHHHIALVAWISLTLSRHSSLSFIALGRSSGQHPVSSHSCWMYVRAGRPAFARPCVGVHKSTSLMSSSLRHQTVYKKWERAGNSNTRS